jgi:hypothetical protein
MLYIHVGSFFIIIGCEDTPTSQTESLKHHSCKIASKIENADWNLNITNILFQSKQRDPI